VKYFKYGLIAIVSYGLFLLVLLPASFVVNYIPPQPGVTLGPAQGTIWQGKLDYVRYNQVTVNNVTWDVLWGPLLQGRLMLDLNLGNRKDDIRGGGEVGYSFAGVVANNFKLSAPLATISQIQPLPLGLKASGMLNLFLDSYQQASPWCEVLSGNLRLASANISSNLGSVDITKAQAVFNCDKGALVAVIKPATNSLGIDAKVRLDQKRQLKVSGFVTPAANAPRDFVELLKFTGQPDSNGRYVLNFKQKI